jgi:hypothetical protein
MPKKLDVQEIHKKAAAYLTLARDDDSKPITAQSIADHVGCSRSKLYAFKNVVEMIRLTDEARKRAAAKKNGPPTPKQELAEMREVNANLQAHIYLIITNAHRLGIKYNELLQPERKSKAPHSLRATIQRNLEMVEDMEHTIPEQA